ncbi:MAG: hypothetical protein J6T65_05175, partial [Clostridia bacterium]|nr:hypothetical protein [Clostridia bacterium]
YNSYIGIAKAVHLKIEYRKSDLLSTYSRSFWHVRKTAKPGKTYDFPATTYPCFAVFEVKKYAAYFSETGEREYAVMYSVIPFEP